MLAKPDFSPKVPLYREYVWLFANTHIWKNTYVWITNIIRSNCLTMTKPWLWYRRHIGFMERMTFMLFQTWCVHIWIITVSSWVIIKLQLYANVQMLKHKKSMVQVVPQKTLHTNKCNTSNTALSACLLQKILYLTVLEDISQKLVIYLLCTTETIQNL